MKTTRELREAVEAARAAGRGRGRAGFGTELRDAVIAWSAGMTSEGVSVDHQARAVGLPPETIRRWCAAALMGPKGPHLRQVSVVKSPQEKGSRKDSIDVRGRVVLWMGHARVEGLGVDELIAVLRGLA